MAISVLIVDDNFGDRMVLNAYLASFGCRVVGQAKNIQESLEKYQALRPDVVLMDVTIPDIDGVAAINRLLRIDHQARVVVSVSHGQRAIAMEALAAGAKEFITKPINPRSLQKAIRLALR